MKTHTKTLLAALTAASVCVGSASAGIINSASFSGSTSAAVDTTGALDWGYVDTAFVSASDQALFANGANFDYSNTDFGALTSNDGETVVTEVSGSSGIGAVTVTETAGTGGAGIGGKPMPVAGYTFDGNTAYGAYGDFGGGDNPVWSMTFNDLGLGARTITLYMGHTAGNRIFTMDATLTGVATSTDGSDAAGISNYGGALSWETSGSGGVLFKYVIDVTTTSADDDLTLTFGSVSGNGGVALLAGYTVTGDVPEPGSLALLGLGGLLIARRRRA
jgi:hypothetical protein